MTTCNYNAPGLNRLEIPTVERQIMHLYSRVFQNEILIYSICPIMNKKIFANKKVKSPNVRLAEVHKKIETTAVIVNFKS